MRPLRIKELHGLSEELCWLKRLSGTREHAKARKVIEDFLRENRIPYRRESFTVEKRMPVKASVKDREGTYEALPLLGSAWAELKGELVVLKELKKDSSLKGKVVALPVGGTREEDKAKVLKELGALALVSYLEELNLPYSGTVGEAHFPAVSLPRETVKKLEGKEVVLKTDARLREVRCTNLVVEFGRGPYLVLLAHYDAKPFTYGAVDNCVSAVLLLLLVKDLIEFQELPMRVRAVFTDCEELGLEGAKYHAKNSKNVLYAVSLDGLGWENPAVLYRDYYGANGAVVNEKFYKHLLDMKVDIPFTESKTGVSDHVPFKEKGVETLFLSSNPYTFRHTALDDYHAVNWEVVKLWYEVVSFFVRRIHRL